RGLLEATDADHLPEQLDLLLGGERLVDRRSCEIETGRVGGGEGHGRSGNRGGRGSGARTYRVCTRAGVFPVTGNQERPASRNSAVKSRFAAAMFRRNTQLGIGSVGRPLHSACQRPSPDLA